MVIKKELVRDSGSALEALTFKMVARKQKMKRAPRIIEQSRFINQIDSFIYS